MSKLRVWWIPQAGATEDSFYVPVETVEEGKKVMDMLAAYDAYQRQNRIKPDYCNCGGVQRWDEDSQDWEDWYLAEFIFCYRGRFTETGWKSKRRFAV